MPRKTSATDARLSEALRWALEGVGDPAMAAADWLARDVAPECGGAWSMLTHSDLTLEQLIAAKNAFKAMRLVGETAADRQLAARLYAAAIAAGIARFDVRITRQSDRAIRRGLDLLDLDHDVPEDVRNLTALARAAIDRRN